MDSNHHGEISPQGPQPCASTNSATGAEGASITTVAGPAATTSIHGLRRLSRRTCIRHHAALLYEHTFVSSHGAPEQESHMDLTKRQQEIFDFIRKYSARYGYPPTVRDIGKAVGLASSSTVHAHLANLEKIGLLRRDPDRKSV